MKLITKLAQSSVGGGDIDGAITYFDLGNNSGDSFNDIISTIIGVLTIIAGIYFFFILVIGAIAWISAGDDKGQIEEAKKKIQNGLVGIAVTVAALFVVQIVGTLLGFTDILDPGGIVGGF